MQNSEIKHEYVTLKISDLKGYEKNQRLHSDSQLEQIEESINEFSFVEVIQFVHPRDRSFYVFLFLCCILAW